MPDMPKPLKGRTIALPETRELDLGARRIGVQLYGNNPNTRLFDSLNGAGSKPAPVVAEQLGAVGDGVHLAPEGAYFMKPLVTAIVAALSRDGGAAVDGK